MSFEFGDVVLVPFPFTSQADSKKRPAVVVSGRGYNESRPDVVVMAITSQLRDGRDPFEVWLADWQAANLLKPSAVKPVFATLERQMVIRQMGKLSRTDQALLKGVILRVLGPFG